MTGHQAQHKIALRPDAVRQARLAAGLSQAELADRIGTGRRTIHRIESGQVTPRYATALLLALALGLVHLPLAEPGAGE